MMGIEKKLTWISKNGADEIYRTWLSDSNTVDRIDLTWKLKNINGFENCQKMLFSMEYITRFLCVKLKNPHEQKWFKISTSMGMPSLRTIYETWRSWGPLTPMGPPATWDPGRVQFFYFLACINQWWQKINSLPYQLCIKFYRFRVGNIKNRKNPLKLCLKTYILQIKT